MIGFSTIEANKMNNMQSNLEKSIDVTLEHLKKYPEYDALEYSFDMNLKRQSECETLQIKINDILEPLGSKIRLIKENKISGINDFKLFKKEMIDIQENIQNLRCETGAKIDLLEKQRLTITEDIQYYNEKLLEWAEPIKIDISNFLKPKTIKNRHKCTEVKQFMDFLHATGGHENGWRKEDHQLFVKLRNKYKNIDVIAKSLNNQLPDISTDEIKKHEEWYKRYLHLQKKKKEALKLWQKTKADNKSSVKLYNNIPSKIINACKEPEENIREKLIKWKREREEKFTNTKELEISQEQRRRDMDLLKKQQQEEIKKVVQEWKENKQAMEQQETSLRRMAEEREKKRRAAEANRMIKQFQSQDDMYILKIRQQKKQEMTLPARSKTSHLAKRDPKRLLKPTRQWINRVHDENCYSNEFSVIMDLKSLPKLSTPEWRKQIID